MIGIIDIGSNTIRLVIYEIRQSSFQPVDEVKVTARLGMHIDEEGALSKKGTKILMDTLKSCRKLIDSYDNCEVRCLATAAIRMAKNRQEILQKIDDKLGFTVEILDGETEAFYGCLSVTQALPYDNGITIDIGGASTEITLFNNRELVQSHSFSFGAVTLQNLYTKGVEIPLKKRIELRSFLKKELKKLPWLRNVGGTIAGLGGNARQLARLSTLYEDSATLGVHAIEVKFSSIERMRTSFAKLKKKEIMNIDALSRNRADLINLVLEVYGAVGEWSGASRFSVSTRGIREGILYEMLLTDSIDQNKRLKEQVKMRGTARILDRYQINTNLAKERVQCVAKLLRSFRDVEILTLDQREKFLAEQAASLFYIGQSISTSKRHQTTFSRLMSATFDGYTQKEKLLVVLMASFKNIKTFKKQLQSYKGLLSKKEIRYARKLGALIKFSNTFIHEEHWLSNIEMEDLESTSSKLNFKVYVDRHAPELMKYSEKQKKHVEKAFAYPVQLLFHY